jgi:proteasome assembly chaperone (PAC2) family protein
MSIMYAQRFKDVDDKLLKDPVAVVGLPGIASVGKIAVETLSKVLNAEHVMDFFSSDFPPRIAVHDGIAHFPKSSIHLYRAASDEPNDVLILSADFQPASSQGVFEYADFVIREFEALGVKEVYALAAYEQGYQDFFSLYPEDPRVFISASSQKLLERIIAIQGTVATKDGIVSGANGFIPAWASSMYNMESACLLGETLGMIKLDYRAAQTVLEKIGGLLGLKARFDVIDDDVIRVVEFLEWAKKEIKQRGVSAERDESPRDRYIG